MSTYTTKQAAKDYDQILDFIKDYQRRIVKNKVGYQPSPTAFLPQDKKLSEAVLGRWAGISWQTFISIISEQGLKKWLRDSREKNKKLFIPKQSKLICEISPITKTKLKIGYGTGPTPFGQCFIAISQENREEIGICKLAFLDEENQGTSLSVSELLEELKRQWPQAQISSAQQQSMSVITRIFSLQKQKKPMALLVQASTFQVEVWRALTCLSRDSIASYSQLAQYIQRSKAVRAVAHAVGQNPIAYLIPCHRIIAKDGKAHRYRWGSLRKLAMLAYDKDKEKKEEK